MYSIIGEIYLARKSSSGLLRCGFIRLIINGKFLKSCVFSSITSDNGQNTGATGLPESDSVNPSECFYRRTRLLRGNMAPVFSQQLYY